MCKSYCYVLRTLETGSLRCTPDLDPRIHVVVDVVIFQNTVPVIIEIHSDLEREVTNRGEC